MVERLRFSRSQCQGKDKTFIFILQSFLQHILSHLNKSEAADVVVM